MNVSAMSVSASVLMARLVELGYYYSDLTHSYIRNGVGVTWSSYFIKLWPTMPNGARDTPLNFHYTDYELLEKILTNLETFETNQERSAYLISILANSEEPEP